MKPLLGLLSLGTSPFRAGVRDSSGPNLFFKRSSHGRGGGFHPPGRKMGSPYSTHRAPSFLPSTGTCCPSGSGEGSPTWRFSARQGGTQSLGIAPSPVLLLDVEEGGQPPRPAAAAASLLPGRPRGTSANLRSLRRSCSLRVRLAAASPQPAGPPAEALRGGREPAAALGKQTKAALAFMIISHLYGLRFCFYYLQE